MGDDKIQKKEPGVGLVKASGAPNLAAMKKQRHDIMPGSDKLKLHSKANEPGITAGVSLQVVIMFDITGSMFKYFDIVRKKLQEIVTAVKKESPNAQFAVFAFRNHGDEDNYSQIYYASPLTANLEEIQAYIAKIEKGGGGHDALTCMEECLHEANVLTWDPNAPKAVVVIGDEPPHGDFPGSSKRA
ncbi:MAG: VWA domain-containing protein [Candidatus Parcubacteria bacterium]|nr:VWA domain-containing protein [Candidatus Parcubacteria bacterium]